MLALDLSELEAKNTPRCIARFFATAWFLLV